MMGKIRLATIKLELQEALRADGLDQAWVARQLRKLRRQARPNAKEVETLVMVRDALAGAGPSSKRKRPRRSRVRT